MKITIVGKMPPSFKGGIERQVENIIDYLKEKGEVEYTMYYFLKGTAVIESGNSERLRYIPCMFFKNNLCFDFWKMRRILREQSDVILINIPNLVVELFFLFARKNAKWIFYFHCHPTRYKFFYFYRYIQKLLLRRADKIITTTARFLDYMELKEFRSKTTVIPNWLSKKFLCSDGTTVQFCRENEPPTLLFVGRLVWYKGISILIEAVKELDVKLLIVGEGPLRSKILRQVKKYNLQRRVKLLGLLSDEKLKLLYQRCNLFVLPSLNEAEGFGISIIEAMANGIPVLCSDLNTGVRDLVRPGETGLLFQPANVQDLQAKIKYAIKNKEFMEKLAENAYNMIMSKFQPAVVGEKFYEEIKACVGV